MWVWVGPRWMRPGSRFSRVMWFVSLPVAAFMIWFGWTHIAPRSSGGGVVFLVVWTLGILVIEAVNFRTMYLARGRQAEAINRAGSTDPAKIQAALKATNLNANQVVTGYNGVKFDEKGQNVLASSLITQMRKGEYVPVWPKDKASAEIQLPYKGW